MSISVPVSGSQISVASFGKPVVDAINQGVAVSYTTAGTVATSVSGAEAAMSAWTVDTTFTFSAGFLYRVDITGGVTNTDTAGTTALGIVRVRKGVNSTSGQQLLYTGTFSRGGSNVNTFANWGYVKNATGSDISTSLGVTVQRSVGGSNYILFGDSNIPLMVTVERVGATADLGSGITGIAASIT